MDIKLSRELCELIGPRELKKFDLEYGDNKAWMRYEKIDLADITLESTEYLRKMIAKHVNAKPLPPGIHAIIKDIDTWMEAVKGDGKTAKARNVEHFCDILTQYLAKSPGHRIFYHDNDRGVKLCYFVDEIVYKPEERHNYSTTPPRCLMSVVWNEFGGRQSKNVVFWPGNCQRMTAPEAMAHKGYTVETAELREHYLAQRVRFHEEVDKVGKQFLACGIGTDDLDGNKDSDRGWWRDTQSINLEKSGEPSQVVIDIFQESDKKEKEDNASYSTTFWSKRMGKLNIPKARFSDAEDDTDDIDDETILPEIPLHPMLAVFALKKHLRLRVHIAQMMEYLYDETLGEKLILPKTNRDLIETLLAHGAGFKDVVKGKGSGAIVLCAGPPGTGKTLTSEVYSEVSSLPLYTVQCSQLGTEPEELEEELLKVFARAHRWKAILLLDEADVYVHKRGNDLQQNAIVGVFLRTLEYYNGVMFLTTNREDLVDDAIASRCVAKVVYDVPLPEDQKRIWRVLSDTSGAGLSDADVTAIVKEFPHLSGRDIKNLLKLGIMVNAAKTGDKRVTLETIKDVKKFKPTADINEKEKYHG